MKKLGLFLLMIVLGTTFSMAQPGGRDMDPAERAKTQTAELKELLGLKSDQEKKVYDLYLKSNKEMTAMREEMQASGGGFEGMREKMTASREEQNKKMKEILTEAQWPKYEKYLEERQARRGQGRQ